MKSFKQFRREAELAQLPLLDSVMIASPEGAVELYEDRKWISGRFDRNIGIDQPTHGAGQQHAHVYVLASGRQGRHRNDRKDAGRSHRPTTKRRRARRR